MNKKALQSIVHILKKRFPNLTAEESIDLAIDIYNAVVKNLAEPEENTRGKE